MRSASSTTWRSLLSGACARSVSELDARRILEEVMGAGGPEWVLELDKIAPERAVAELESLLERRAEGEPLQYVVGHWGFRRLDLLVDRRVLIPRPETEQVVQLGLTELRGLLEGRAERAIAVDLGTGSGAIAFSIAAEEPRAEVWATDSSAGALAVATANLAGLAGRAAARVRLCRGSWFDPLPRELAGAVSLVVSNPPYVSENELSELPREVLDWEPLDALVSGPTGLEAIAAILEESPVWIGTKGAVVLEISPRLAEDARALALGAGFQDVEVFSDLAARPRVLVGRR